MWSSKNPLTLFGADATKQSAEEVRRFFRLVASLVFQLHGLPL
jgi:hypothetical protein